MEPETPLHGMSEKEKEPDGLGNEAATGPSWRESAVGRSGHKAIHHSRGVALGMVMQLPKDDKLSHVQDRRLTRPAWPLMNGADASPRNEVSAHDNVTAVRFGNIQQCDPPLARAMSTQRWGSLADE